MELLKSINDNLWKVLFELMKPISDNVGINIILISVLVGVSLSFSRLIIFKQRAYSFGPLDYLVTLSVSYAVNRLPIIHHRMNTILSTVSGIISSSNDYLSVFQNSTNIITDKTRDIATFFYYLPQDKYSFWKQKNPTELYQRMLDSMNDIRSIGVAQIHEKSFGTFSFMFILVISIVIIAFFVNCETTVKMLFFIIRATFLIYTTTLNNGATLCALLLWGVETVIIQTFNSKKENILNEQ